MLSWLNWIETIETLAQYHPDVIDEVMIYLESVIIPGDVEQGKRDEFIERSYRFAVRDGLLVFADIDMVTMTLDVLSIETPVGKSNLH